VKINRRTFLAWASVASAGAVAGGARLARGAGPAGRPIADDTPSMLVDTTKCRGCRGCEAACSEANGMPEPERAGEKAAFDKFRETSTRAFTVVNRFPGRTTDAAPVYVKRQCMHCVEPACASACLARALTKTPDGPVVYNRKVCIGCRYCMVACPFAIPKFEYEKALPYVRKCSFCIERQRQGKKPACAHVCPSGALTFGKRKEMLELARTRIYQSPDKYIHYVYGEREAGGTGWLYISSVDFAGLSFKPVRTSSYAELTSGALGAVPIILTIGPPLLMGLYAATRVRERKVDSGKEGAHE
jgi:formate dehydrogenase iron-sulfur subunit